LSIAPDEIPKKVGRYVIEESIGYGAMGAVYRALDPLISRTVAIKTIRLDVPPASPHYQSFLRRFYTEAKASGALSHPNIVTVYDIGETDDKIPFLAMEFVDGDTVADLLEMGEKLRPEQVVALVSQMADAIDYAHSKGVIHRDIKPSNIIVYDGEKVKITDFGIAKLMDAEGTQTASLLGTPSYMSPEQAMGEHLDGRTDIFSLGVVAFEMLSGQQPFPGNNVTSILYKLVHSDPVQPGNLEILGLLPDKWHRVFSKVLSKNPSERYGQAADFVTELEHCLGSWFGALEGETVVMTASEASQLVEKVSDEPPPSVEKEVEEVETGDETVLLKSSELPSGSPASDRQSPSKTRPPAEEEEQQETVLLRSELEAETEPHPTGVPEETVTTEAPVVELPPPPLEEDERETMALEVGDAETVASTGMPEWSPPPSTEQPETVVAQADSVATDRAAVPKDLGPARTKKDKRPVPFKILVAASAVLLVLLALAVAIQVFGGRGEIPTVPEIPPPEPPAPIEGMLEVSSEPEGAAVWLDGEEIGATPLERANLALGVYVVRLELDGYESQDLVADLRDDTPEARLDVTLRKPLRPKPAPKRAFINVTSTPSGASVLIDGKPVGDTPVERFRAQPGSRSVVVQMEGYQPWETSIDLKAGASESIEAALEPIEVPPPPEPEPPEVQVGALVERGPDVVDPKCVDCPNPPYPPAALKAKIQGVVGLSFIVTENGTVQEIQVTESAGELFDQSVINVVKDWRFEPATKSGVRVKVRLSRRFRYRRGR
jgi:serine/threonine-protein kinase